MKKWGHNELQHDLALHLRGQGDKVVWENMQMGPVGSARPDVYVIPKSYSKFRPITYEIKISVSDFRSDITSGKWQSYLEFSAGVIFAVPAGLITKDDVPKGCGLIVRHDEIWRMAKAPTLQHIEQLPKNCWMKLMIDGIERQAILATEPRSLNKWAVQQKIRQKYGNELAQALSDLQRAEENLLNRKVKFENMANELQALRDEAIKEAMTEQSRYIDPARNELCEALGLPQTASAWEISRKCRELANRLSQDNEINRLQALLRKVHEVCTDAEKPLPGLEAA